MTKEFLMRTLFEAYYDYANLDSDNIFDAKMALCEDKKQELAFRGAIADASEKAFTSGFNAALALMGGVQS